MIVWWKERKKERKMKPDDVTPSIPRIKVTWSPGLYYLSCV
jgi:hypothetical protein